MKAASLSILTVHILLLDQAQVGFMHQRRGLQQMIGAFASHVIRCEAAQFVIDQRHELLQACLIPIAPCLEHFGNLG